MTTGSQIDPKQFRNVLGHFATGVTVVTSLDADGPTGLTIGSFTSVSLDPPLVGWLPSTQSSTWGRIRATGVFCVNILSASQEDKCWVFASTDESVDRFDGVNWHPAPLSGAPIIADSIGWISCSIETVHPAGDHDFVVGRVHALAAARPDDAPANPLIFFGGSLGHFTPKDTSS